MSEIQLNYNKGHKVTDFKIFNFKVFDKFLLRMWRRKHVRLNLVLMAAVERVVIAGD